jgi:hypothetical protein
VRGGTNDDVYEFVMDVAAHDGAVDELAEPLRGSSTGPADSHRRTAEETGLQSSRAR